jgi:hypothetical protein
MIKITNWRDTDSDLLAAVHPVNPGNPEELEITQRVMSSAIEAITQNHGASFNKSGLHKNLHALIKRRLKGYLYYAKWKGSAKEICVGAAFGWKTYGITPGGIWVDSEYTEDVAIPRNMALRDLLRFILPGMKIPDRSLAEIFEEIYLKEILAQKGIVYRFGEVNLDNTAMVRQLRRNKAIIDENIPILDLKRIPNNLLENFPMTPEIIELKDNGVRDENSFGVRLNEDGFDHRVVATMAQGTASAKRRMDLRTWHQGKIPSPKVMDDIISSSLIAVKREADEREWGKEEIEYPSPMLPLFEARPDIARALYPGAGNQITVNADQRPKTIVQPISDMHIFADKTTIKGFEAKGAVQRVFGGRPMSPVVNNLRHACGD